MKTKLRRIFVEKKASFAVEAVKLFTDFKETLDLPGLKKMRLVNRYDLSGISDSRLQEICELILADLAVDSIYQEEIELKEDEKAFAVEYLPGQYDQRADLTEKAIQILNKGELPQVKAAQVFILKGDLSQTDLEKIKDYYINSIETRELSLKKPKTLENNYKKAEKIEIINGFIEAGPVELKNILSELELAMSMADLKHSQKYFREQEKRNPTLTEIKLLDTYWSDHCRHTTFLTKIEEVEIEKNQLTAGIENAYQKYLEGRERVYSDQAKDISLMDIALMGMKELKAEGALADLEISNEVNAASIEITVDVDGEDQDWLLMFKNETHNHPTEIEPFGGAATCLGGAIRDPLSGRSYVYQAMRISGAADPRTPINETLAGKLPQRKIVKEAAAGYSSYGNQIGVPAGMVAEFYDQRFLAKHLELGAVAAAAPKENVVRGQALAGDLIVLLGGKTGRDGCGGAAGSSKIQTEDSIEESGAEVQKGNPLIERNIQRLFRKPELSRKIKVCNDFGAGGVAVAIGELADSLEINLNAVPTKYEGLDGTELAISESQERMAVVIDQDDLDQFVDLAAAENLEATAVAEVKDHGRLIMGWNGEQIVDLSREFLNTNGAAQKTKVKVKAPAQKDNYFKTAAERLAEAGDLKEKWLHNLADLNNASQKGLVERFDSTAGAGTVLMPFGGKYQLTPTQTMAAKIPLLKGETNTGTLMSYGYDPKLSSWSPFHGAAYAVVESIAKITASGGDYRKIRFSFQEYFERLEEEPERWGKPFSAVLGAYQMQKDFGIPAIGGKDSMSGSFKDIDVPPSLVSFAVDTVDLNHVISAEFKKAGNKLVYLPVERRDDGLPEVEKLKRNYKRVEKIISEGKIKAAAAVTAGGLAEIISKMSFGNKIGVEIKTELSELELFSPEYGALILEVSAAESELKKLFEGLNYKFIGQTIKAEKIKVKTEEISLETALKNWQQPLEEIYKTELTAEAASELENKNEKQELLNFEYYQAEQNFSGHIKQTKPNVLIPIFPGTSSEYEMAKKFRKAGAEVENFVFKNFKASLIKKSITELAAKIKKAQIFALPGGLTAGNEPDGAAKFTAAVLRQPEIKAALVDLLNNRDGLILGIANGFQTLIKVGLLPYGEFRARNENSPSLSYNKIGRHVSQMVRTKITSTKSPWLTNLKLEDIHILPVSHSYGRFTASTKIIKELQQQGQIFSQYVDLQGKAVMKRPHNPNGSAAAVEGICSPDGRILGKMANSERIGKHLAKNITGNKDQKLFQAGVNYFK